MNKIIQAVGKAPATLILSYNLKHLDMLNFNYKDPSIELVSEIDDSKTVWRISRPHLSENDPELMRIGNMDLPVNDFHRYVFKITSSLLFRDLLYHIRPTADWARSNRTTQINKDTLFYSSEYKKYYDEMEDGTYTDDSGCNCECDLAENHEYITNPEVNLDIRKDKFPYSVSTDYCWGCDKRTLVSFLRSLYKGNKSLFEVYGVQFMNILGVKTIDELPPGSDTILESISIPYEFSRNDETIVGIDKEFNTVKIQYRGTGSLLSQFIRQHRATVRSELITMILEYNLKDLVCMKQDMLFFMQSITTVELAIKMMKTRACWFSKQDKASKSSWSDIVSKLIERSGFSFISCLPCDGYIERCPWKSEQLARCLANKPGESKGEVNTPCPIITGLSEMGELRKAKFNSDSSLYQHWLEYCKEHELDPTQYGIDYIQNVVNWGFVEECDNENEDMIEIINNVAGKLGISNTVNNENT